LNIEAIKNAVLFILEKAKDRDISIGRTRLIKILYLLDVEYFRQSQRKFSGINWIFYKYGPYAFEVEDLLRDIDIEEEEIVLSSKKTFKKYSGVMDDEPIALSIEVKSIIEKILESWGTADLNEFLEYIYFETEPMSAAKFKETLNFNSIKRIEPPFKLVLSPEERIHLGIIGANLKEHLNKIINPQRLVEKLPLEFSSGIFSWDEDCEDISSVRGRVKL
jgi:hypothetical protein